MTALRRLLHISDVHFGPRHLPAVSAGIEALVERERPHLVVLSGDLTQRAKPAQFREARAFVERLARTSPVLAVPGNHDVPLWRVWERLLAPFGAYRRHFREELEWTFVDDALFVAGINTAQAFAFKGGRVREKRLAEVEKELTSTAANRFRIVVAHHHLLKPDGVDCEHACWGAIGAAERLARAGADLVLSGHLHQTLELFPAGPGAFPALHTGTSSSSRGRGPETGRNSAHWIEVGSESFMVRGLVWNPAATAFDPAFERRYQRRSPRPGER